MVDHGVIESMAIYHSEVLVMGLISGGLFLNPFVLSSLMHALVRPRLQFVTHTLNSASTGQDNKIHERKSGIMFHKREVRRVKRRRIPDRKRRVEPQQARIRYWTRRERLRIKYIQIQKQRSVSEEEIVRIARNLSDIDLPFCTPCEGRDLSNET